MNHRIALTALALSTLLAAPASAQSVHALDGSHEILAQNYQGRVLYIKFTHPNGAVDYATAFRYNDYYALTAAHVVGDIKAGTTPVVGTGSNAISDPGTTRNIIDYGTHPTWGGAFNGTALDIGWLRFDSPLPGPVETIKATGLGMNITTVGFGRPATPATGLLPVDRERRAITIPVDQNGASGSGISANYVLGQFQTLAQRNLPYAGVVTVGNSGSPGYSDDGYLRTMANAVLGDTSYGSYTVSLRLKSVEPWILEVTAPPCPADTNGDGILDNGDIGVFINLFLAGDLAADFNGDGILDNGDIGAFVTAFLAGC